MADQTAEEEGPIKTAAQYSNGLRGGKRQEAKDHAAPSITAFQSGFKPKEVKTGQGDADSEMCQPAD